ncbi:MAG: hypothetical protein GC201_07115 [Alphaproteobacteria bacterium]|nr:hypothetical protein [Alphaproteobacteria bacterium]
MPIRIAHIKKGRRVSGHNILAIVHGAGEKNAARRLMQSLGRNHAVALRISDGGLLLCSDRQLPDPPAGMPLWTIDGTGGGAEIRMPTDLIDAGDLPVEVLRAVRQFRSHLYRDAGGRLWIWTDHVGLSTVYHARAGQCSVFSSDPAALSRLSAGLDLDMAVSFLSSGVVLPGRTLFTGIEALPCASALRVEPGGISGRPYWRPRPGTDLWRNRADMEEELWVRIRRSVIASAADRHVTLPLSGGNDATTLLGLLHEAGCSLDTFSFVVGDPTPNCDAAVAGRQAALLGVPHRLYSMDDFSVVHMLERHAAGPVTMRKACYEQDIYEQAAADSRAAYGDPLFMFGDECFGQGAIRLGSDEDMLSAWTLKSPAIVDGLADALDAQAATSAKEGLRAAQIQALDMHRDQRRPADMKDAGFLEIFHRQNMMPMRRLNASATGSIAVPFMELSILDMARHVPDSLRVEKHLFKGLVRKRLPRLFALRRATSAQSQPRIDAAMHAEAVQIHRIAARLRHGIPGLLTGENLVRLADELISSPVPVAQKRSLGGRLVHATYHSPLVPVRLKYALMNRLWTKYHMGADKPTLLMRAIQLALLVAASPLGEAPAAPPPDVRRVLTKDRVMTTVRPGA